MIPSHTIEEIRNKADIEDVVSDYVSLKKKGKNLWGCCPFHDEKTPSFTVSPAKGIFKCFGCGKAGDSITFIMEKEKFAYTDALKYLAQKYGITIEEKQYSLEEKKESDEKEALYHLLHNAKEKFQKNLLQEQSQAALTYLKNRGLNTEVMQKFELGYSLDAWNDLLNYYKKMGYSEELLEKSGIIIVREEESGKKIYDRFRNRIMFPIHNLIGKTIGFGARLLKNEENQPKYLNSPETIVYKKNEVLYGIFQAKESIKHEDNCYLCEGYMDVISLHMAGIQNTVAASGTSLTENQIKQIKRFTHNVTTLFDGDNAGIKASFRGIDMLLSQDINVKVVPFPENEDPDSYAHKLGPQLFKEFLKTNATDFILFKTKILLKNIQNDPIKKTEITTDIITSISCIPNIIKRDLYIQECSDILKINKDIIEVALQNILSPQKKDTQKNKIHPTNVTSAKEKPIKEKITYQEEESIRILLLYGKETIKQPESQDIQALTYFFKETEDDGISFQSPLYQEIYALFKQKLQEGILVDMDYFLKHESLEIRNCVASLIGKEDKHEFSKNWQERYEINIPTEKEELKQSMYTNIIRLKLSFIKFLRKQNIEKLTNPEYAQDEILQEIKEQNTIIQELSKIIGKVYEL